MNLFEHIKLKDLFLIQGCLFNNVLLHRVSHNNNGWNTEQKLQFNLSIILSKRIYFCLNRVMNTNLTNFHLKLVLIEVNWVQRCKTTFIIRCETIKSLLPVNIWLVKSWSVSWRTFPLLRSLSVKQGLP